MLGGVPGIPASHVVIVGAGTAGSTAARVFLGYGASVTVMDEDLKRLRAADSSLPKFANTALATPYNLERYRPFGRCRPGRRLGARPESSACDHGIHGSEDAARQRHHRSVHRSGRVCGNQPADDPVGSGI